LAFSYQLSALKGGTMQDFKNLKHREAPASPIEKTSGQKSNAHPGDAAESR
jgi:hypothetical protein